jgi:hypothetical protein
MLVRTEDGCRSDPFGFVFPGEIACFAKVYAQIPPTSGNSWLSPIPKLYTRSDDSEKQNHKGQNLRSSRVSIQTSSEPNTPLNFYVGLPSIACRGFMASTINAATVMIRIARMLPSGPV